MLAFVLNVASTLFRALSWSLTISQALPPQHQPRLIQVFSSFGVGLLANAIVPGRLGELARVATLRRHLPNAPPGTTATLVGTVFAHRLFDLVPATMLVVWVLLTADVPHWAVTALLIVVAVGFTLFTVAWMSARRHQRSVAHDLQAVGTIRHLLGMARQGLSVLKAPVPLAGRDPPPVPRLAAPADGGVGDDAGLRHRRPVAGRRPRPRPDERRDDHSALAGKRRARSGRGGVAAPQLRRRLRDRFAFGLALQAIEIACGVALGLLALAREGISVAMLRRMQDDEEQSSSENAVEEAEELVDDLEHEATREGASVSR